MRKLLLAAAVALVTTAAQAVPTMIITIVDTDGGATSTCSITSAGLGVCAGSGTYIVGGGNAAGNLEMVFTGNVGGYALSFTTSQSNTPGNSMLAEINMGYTNVRNLTSAGRLFVSISALEFTLPAGPALTMFGSQALSANGGSVGNIESNFFANAANGNPPQTGATATLACDFDAATALGCNAGNTNWTRGAGAFSLQDIVIFDLDILAAGSSGVNGSSNLVVRNRIPEPMTTALVGMGLFGAAFFSRRRKAAQA